MYTRGLLAGAGTHPRTYIFLLLAPCNLPPLLCRPSLSQPHAQVAFGTRVSLIILWLLQHQHTGHVLT